MTFQTVQRSLFCHIWCLLLLIYIYKYTPSNSEQQNQEGDKHTKFMQPLRTKNHTTSRDEKKITQPLGTRKKIMQPLKTKKKSCNISGQKKSRNLPEQQNHANSWDKKMQPLGTTKKSRNLSGQQNHATSQDKKIMLSIGQIASKLVHMAPNWSKWHQTCPNRSK